MRLSTHNALMHAKDTLINNPPLLQSIDIPPAFHSPSSYSATLAHVSNHSPRPNAVYGMIDHPRFGRIRSIVALKDLEDGDEIFCDYGYLDQYNK